MKQSNDREIAKARVREALCGLRSSLKQVNRSLLHREFKDIWKIGRMKTLIRGMLATADLMTEDLIEGQEK